MSFFIDEILKEKNNPGSVVDCFKNSCEIRRPTPIRSVQGKLKYSIWNNKIEKHISEMNTTIHYTENAIINSSDVNYPFWTYPLNLNRNTNNFPKSIISNKRKGGQIRFTTNQTEMLEQKFHSNKYLNPDDRKHLAELLQLSDRQIKTWFQNRRAKWRRFQQLLLEQYCKNNILNSLNSNDSNSSTIVKLNNCYIDRLQ